jgi:hypothetical protein
MSLAPVLPLVPREPSLPYLSSRLPYLNPIGQLDGIVDDDVDDDADDDTFQSSAPAARMAATGAGSPEPHEVRPPDVPEEEKKDIQLPDPPDLASSKGGRPAPAPPSAPPAAADAGRASVRLRTTALDFSKWLAVFQIDDYDSIHEQFHHRKPSCFLCGPRAGRSYGNGWRTSYCCALGPPRVKLK